MGRKKELQNKTDLTIVVEQTQKDQLIREAKEAGMTASRYIRGLLFDKGQKKSIIQRIFNK